MDGNRVDVFSAEKTIADCFEYHNNIGPDAALEARNTYLRADSTEHFSGEPRACDG